MGQGMGWTKQIIKRTIELMMASVYIYIYDVNILWKLEGNAPND
jgi:hypothetical protein